MSQSETSFNIVDFFEKCGTFQDLAGIDSNTLEGLYSVAHHLYTINKYKEAEQAFALLCFYNHLERKYWLGLGAVRQMQKKHKEALDAFSYAAMLGFDDPSAHMYSADCYLAIGQKEHAINALNTAVELCGTNPAHKVFKLRAKGLLEVLGAPDLSKPKEKSSKQKAR